MMDRTGSLFLLVYLPLLQPQQKVLGLNIHNLHFIRKVKRRIRNPLFHINAGNGFHNIAETFDMLNVNRCIDSNSRL